MDVCCSRDSTDRRAPRQREEKAKEGEEKANVCKNATDCAPKFGASRVWFVRD